MTERRVTSRTPLLLGALIAVGPVATDMYLPAFPALARDLHDPAAPQYSLAAYFVGLAIGQMTQGALSDRLGRRVPLLAGLALFVLACVGTWLSWNTASLVVFRFLMALGASAGVVIPRAMVRDLADGPQAAKLLSRLMLVMGVAPITAPMLGAAVVQFFSWRVIFALCALYGVGLLAATWRYLPDTLPPERRLREGPLTSLQRYAGIFTEPSFLAHASVGAFTSGCLFAYLGASPVVFQTHFGWSTAEFAALFGFNSIAYIFFSQMNPILVDRWGVAPVVTLGVSVLLVACLALGAAAVLHASALVVAAVLLLTEGGFGLLTSCATIGALSRHQHHAGSAAALIGTMQYVAGALTSLLVGLLADGTARPMGYTMLLCALLAALAAALRPKLVFAPAE